MSVETVFGERGQKCLHSALCAVEQRCEARFQDSVVFN